MISTRRIHIISNIREPGSFGLRFRLFTHGDRDLYFDCGPVLSFEEERDSAGRLTNMTIEYAESPTTKMMGINDWSTVAGWEIIELENVAGLGKLLKAEARATEVKCHAWAWSSEARCSNGATTEWNGYPVCGKHNGKKKAPKITPDLVKKPTQTFEEWFEENDDIEFDEAVAWLVKHGEIDGSLSVEAQRLVATQRWNAATADWFVEYHGLADKSPEELLDFSREHGLKVPDLKAAIERLARE